MALAAVCGLCACGGTDVIADVPRPTIPDAGAGTEGTAGAGSGEAGALNPPLDAGTGPSATGSPDLAAWCSGRGGLWTIRGNGQGSFTCAGELAARSFGLALCACGQLTGPGGVSTATLRADGSLSPGGAHVGSNGADVPTSAGYLSMVGTTLPGFTIGGDLVLTGRGSAFASGAQRVTGSLRSAAALAGSANTAVRIDGDAWLPLVSALDARALDVGGELVLTPAGAAGSESERWNAARTGGGLRRADQELPPPCACDLEQAPDVPAMVAWAAANNDNAQLGFSPERLYWVAQATALSVPCGRYHVPTINGSGVLTLRIDQPVALYVGDLLGFIEVELGPQGSLDLFVSGLFQPRGGRLGDPARPAATRVYVHTQVMPGPLAMLGELSSNFYGPTVGVQAFDVLRRGSMVVRDLIVTDGLRVEYDPRVTQGASCGAR